MEGRGSKGDTLISADWGVPEDYIRVVGKIIKGQKRRNRIGTPESFKSE